MLYQPGKVYKVFCLLCRRYLGNYQDVMTGRLGYYCTHCGGHTRIVRDGSHLIEEFEIKEPNAGQYQPRSKHAS